MKFWQTKTFQVFSEFSVFFRRANSASKCYFQFLIKLLLSNLTEYTVDLLRNLKKIEIKIT